MPFLRPTTVRTVTLTVTVLATLATTIPVARAELGPATIAPAAGADTGITCPVPMRPTWHERGMRGCVELYRTTDTGTTDAGTTDAGTTDVPTTVTPAELALLNLGDLPAWASVDVDAIAASLAAFEQHLADQAAATAAEQAAREAADRAARDSARRTSTPAPSTRRVRQPLLSIEQLEQILAECGIVFDPANGPITETPCMAAAMERMRAELPVFEVPSGPGFPALPADWHDALLVAVNGERASHGVRRVSSCPSLTRTAQAYAEVLRDWGQISHTGPDGSDPFDRAVDGGYSIRVALSPGVFMVDGMVGENLGAGYASVPEVMYGWMTSPGHRRNLLDGRWSDAGFGLARASSGDRYGYYWVQLFGDGTGNC